MQQLPAFLEGIKPMSYAEPTVFGGLSKTETKIKEIAQQQQPKQKNLTKQDLFDDAKKIVEAKGISREEAMQNTLKYYQAKGLQVEGVDIDAELNSMQPQEEIEEEKSLLGKVGEGYVETMKGSAETLGAGVANVPNMIGNTLGFLADVVTPEKFEGLGDALRDSGVRQKEDMQEIMGIDPDSFNTKAGEFGSEVLALFIPGGQGKLLSKFPQAADKISDLANVVSNIEQKAPKLYSTIKSAATGAKEVAKYEVVSEGEVTPEGVAIGAVANPIIGTTIKGIGKITRPLAENLELMGLLNPAKLKIVSDQLKAEGVENVSVGKYLLDRNIKGSKEKILGQLDDLANQSKGEVDTAIGGIKGTFKNDSVDGVINQIRKDFADVPGQEAVVNRASELFRKSTSGEGLTLKEIQEVKRMADKHLNLFTIPGDVRAGALKQGLANLRGNIQKFIEETAKKNGVNNIKQLNKETQVNRTLIDAIERKESADQVREMLSAFSTTGIGSAFGGASAIAQGQDPMTILKSVLIGGAIGKAAGSTALKTQIANILNKLTPAEKQGFNNFIDSNGAKPLNTGILNKIIELSTNATE